MSAMPDSTLANPEQLIADLRRQLAECKAERDEGLQRETATAEVLQVINSSPGDLALVFDAILDKAQSLCGAAFGLLFTYDREHIQAAALHNIPAGFAEFLRRGAVTPAPGTTLARAIEQRKPVQMVDAMAEGPYREGDPFAVSAIEAAGVRTVLSVPLVKDDAVLGVIGLFRQEVRPFTDKQIALLQNFAAQAVIAMENARLVGELRERTGDLEESLQYQTATSDVLQVISRSTFDLEQVFATLVETAARLCAADMASVQRRDGEVYPTVALCGFPPEFAAWAREHPHRADRESIGGRAILERRIIHVTDLAADPEFGWPEAARRFETRSVLAMPLMREGEPLGTISLVRRRIEPFTERQIELVRTFADQAVIAMENARLITETREALEQQTATAEVLQVINSSPGDLTPVFDAMLEKAHRLCGATHGLFGAYDGERFRAVATRGIAPSSTAILSQPFYPPPGSPHERLLRGEQMVHIADLAAETEWERDDPKRHVGLKEGIGTALFVPLRKDGRLVGYLSADRQEVKPFAEREIALLQSFAAQAVIAMENARLLTETREALEQQTATAEVLQVINSSPGNLAPVFAAMLEKATRLCEASFGTLSKIDGDQFCGMAWHNAPAAFVETMRQPRTIMPGNAHYRLLQGEDVVHIEDVTAEDVYRSGNPARRALADLAGARTVLWAALRKDNKLLGAFVIYRQEVRPFTEKQIALLQNFAAQAVIAMENARLLTETREALEQQTATAEVLQVINSSPGDLAPVFDAILEKARTLCGAALGDLMIFDKERFHQVAVCAEPRFAEYWRQNPLRPPLEGDGPLSRLMRGECLVHLPDVREGDAYRKIPEYRRRLDLGGIRTLLAVPLLKDGGDMIGVINIYRQDMRPFSDKQIALLQNFAAQAVIAMENARLLTETREALQQQTATAEVLQVINSSPGDLAPVFDAILEKAHSLCDVSNGSLQLYDSQYFHTVATRGMSQPLMDLLREPYSPDPDGLLQPLIAGARRFVQIDDQAAELAAQTIAPNPRMRLAVELDGIRTALFLPLRKNEELLGMISCARHQVRPFTDKQIALLENFAAQAVIAMENARLLTETREALEQQTATAEVLQVINSSPGDLAPVFDAMLEKAMHLCEAAFGFLSTYDGEYFHAVALRGVPHKFVEGWLSVPYRSGPNTTHDRLIRGERLVHVPDLAADGVDDPRRRAVLEVAGIRSILGVPLRKEGVLLGAIHIYRTEVRPFTDKQIALAENFAAQAVIAIENARLIDEIRQRQAELRVTFDNMGDGVVMFDQELRLTAWNRNFQELLDLPDEFLAGRPSFAEYFRYLAARGEYPADLEAELSRGLADTGAELRFERTRPDGRVIEVRRNAVPGGGFVLIYSDITERKQAEARLRAARDTAEGALRELRAAQANLIHAEKMASLGQLTAGIAHEIKNPLNFVNNFAGLSVELLDELKEAAAPAVASLGDDERADIDELVTTLSGNLDKIAEHGRRADGIVTSMLLHSRGGSNERRQIDLNALVDEALNLAYHGARARDQSFDIVLEREFDSTARPIELVPQDITRVLLNLIGNGFYAAFEKCRAKGDGARPLLKLTTCELGEAVEIRVRDNGMGIPPEIRDKLFQPFFTTKPTGEGTGLGLSISWDIVTQQHGGTIAVDSRVGEFTEFTVRLPRSFVAAPN